MYGILDCNSFYASCERVFKLLFNRRNIFKLDGIKKEVLEAYVLKIKNTIEKYIRISVSIGVAKNKSLSKVANKIAKKYTIETY